MTNFTVPTKEEVSAENQATFEGLEKKLGFVPNVYAALAYSDNALNTYLSYAESQAKGSLSAKEREAINLIVSQVNGCRYCQSAHTAIGKMNGFTDEEVIQLRKGESDDAKLDALVKLAREIAINRGNPSEAAVSRFFEAGYDKGNLIDVVLVVSDITVTNYVNNITQVPIDFPVAPDLTQEVTA